LEMEMEGRNKKQQSTSPYEFAEGKHGKVWEQLLKGWELYWLGHPPQCQ